MGGEPQPFYLSQTGSVDFQNQCIKPQDWKCGFSKSMHQTHKWNLLNKPMIWNFEESHYKFVILIDLGVHAKLVIVKIKN